MAIYLGKPPERDFARMPHEWTRSPKISGLAKAVLGYLLSHRSGYPLTMKQMAGEFKEGEDALYAAIRELITAGYVRRAQHRGGRGKTGAVHYLVIGADGEFPQVVKASGFSGSANPGSVTTCNDAEFPQVVKASGVSGSATYGSGGSGTKKNNPKKTKDLQDEEKTPSSCAAAAPRAASPEEEGEDISNDQQADNHTTTAAGIADRYRPNITAIEARRLAHPIADALRNGWTVDALRTELDADHTGLANLAAGLITRARTMAGSTPPAPPPQQAVKIRPDAHPFEPHTDGITCHRCGFPRPNARHLTKPSNTEQE